MAEICKGYHILFLHSLLTGSSGPSGSPGAQGPAGANGATGPKGQKGSRGVSGAFGPEGPAGMCFHNLYNYVICRSVYLIPPLCMQGVRRVDPCS